MPIEVIDRTDGSEPEYPPDVNTVFDHLLEKVNEWIAANVDKEIIVRGLAVYATRMTVQLSGDPKVSLRRLIDFIEKVAADEETIKKPGD